MPGLLRRLDGQCARDSSLEVRARTTSRREAALGGFKRRGALATPTLIQVGSAETLLDDATRLAAAMGAADVAVTLEIWPRMIHAWALWNARLEDGRKGRASRRARSRSAATALAET